MLTLATQTSCTHTRMHTDAHSSQELEIYALTPPTLKCMHKHRRTASALCPPHVCTPEGRCCIFNQSVGSQRRDVPESDKAWRGTSCFRLFRGETHTVDQEKSLTTHTHRDTHSDHTHLDHRLKNKCVCQHSRLDDHQFDCLQVIRTSDLKC